MERFKISTRLTISFALMVVLLAVLGGVALFGSSIQRSALDEITERRIPLSRSLNTILDGTNEQAIQFRNLVLFQSGDIKDSAHTKIRDARTSIAEQVKTLTQLISSEKGKSLLERLLVHRAKFLQQGDEFIALVDGSRHDEALAMLEAKLRPTQLEYQQVIHELLADQTQRAEKSSQQAETAANQLVWEVLVTGAIATVIAVFLALAIVRSITRPLAQAMQVANRVASGDLSASISATSKDEMGLLLGALERMQHSLVTTVTSVRSNAQGVAAASAQIAAGNNDLSGRTEEQASALEQTAASMEQLGSTVKQNAEHATQANQMAKSASVVAIEGGKVVDQVVATMKSIDESSKKIADIISVIDSIAFQTNILALNAAVEAARAGEQGRGFAVVASEVRALAGRSAEAAKEIKTLITTSVERVEQGSLLVDKAGRTMTDVVSAIGRVTDIMGEISAASQEQSQGLAQVGEAATQMDQTTQQNAALVEEMAAAASSLNHQARSLVDAVAVFKLSEEIKRSGSTMAMTHTSVSRQKTAANLSKPRQEPLASIKPIVERRPATIAGTQRSTRDKDVDWETF
ncbi:MULTISPECIES: methyl-accepting chemotaxis protein [Comamonas]|uniref:methyl-accepting chemotaxis protein n=1 Tax=Comamonas TaxID=283 RepID=UPI0011E64F3D|nr:methyl-accepting chemotaxis protein [Comamonas sp. Z1]TYK69153.1 HAMP domain-containing protein [Comamonas sp. Z1]BCX51807.1 methyl-accepting chemotaxis protein [Comamonas testosteroni]